MVGVSLYSWLLIPFGHEALETRRSFVGHPRIWSRVVVVHRSSQLEYLAQLFLAILMQVLDGRGKIQFEMVLGVDFGVLVGLKETSKVDAVWWCLFDAGDDQSARTLWM